MTSWAGTGGAPEVFGDRVYRPVAESRAPWTGDIAYCGRARQLKRVSVAPNRDVPSSSCGISDSQFCNVHLKLNHLCAKMNCLRVLSVIFLFVFKCLYAQENYEKGEPS